MERGLLQWEQALERYEQRRGRNIRWDDLERIVAAIHQELRPIASVKALKDRYAQGNYWALRIAQRLYPNDPDLWDLHYTADVAYGLRYRELAGAAPAKE